MWERDALVLHVRELTGTEERQLHGWLECDNPVLRHRAQVIVLSSQGYRVPEIGPMLSSHPANLRKWIHRFNEGGCEGLRTVHAGGPNRRFSSDQRDLILHLANTRPRDLGLRFTRWTLHKLAEEAGRRGIVDRISHECVRQILRAASCDYKRSGDGSGR